LQRNGDIRREWIVFRVTDNGMGMSPDQVKRLFEPFTQGDASLSRKYGGTGLGLAICRHFCQMMGGEIDVSSELGVGSTFTVKIPAEVSETRRKRSTGEILGLQAPERPQTAEAGSDESTTEEPTTTTGSYIVLVIDDDETIHDQMKRILTKEGYRVISAMNGKDGLELARRLRPNVITLDVLMPDMNGWAVLSVLKADQTLQYIPVILVTMVDNRDVGFTLGASDFLLKPIERQALLRLLNNYRSATAPKETPTVLVVEDDLPNRELLVRMLADEGWIVNEAENGRAALNSVGTTQPDLIFLDLMMPEMDGFQFLAELRKNEKWRQIPVVVVTAMVLSAEDMERLNANVQQILQKSAYTREQLLQEVQKLVHRFVPLPPPQPTGGNA
jgi:CheY-like chemotaxis protein